MISNISCAWVFAALLCSSASSQNLPEDMISVRYALEIDGWRPVTGESYCFIDKDCVVGFDFDPVRLTLRFASSGEDSVEIVCRDHPDGCFLGNAANRIFSHRGSVEDFTVYDGQGQGQSGELVLRYPEKIGRVLLHYRVWNRPDFSRGERAGKPLPRRHPIRLKPDR